MVKNCMVFWFCLLVLLSFNSWGLEQLANGRAALVHLGNGGCYVPGYYVTTGNMEYRICVNEDGFFVDNKGAKFTPNFGDWEDTAKTIPRKYYKWESQAVVTEGSFSTTLSAELDKTSLSATQKASVIQGTKKGLGL